MDTASDSKSTQLDASAPCWTPSCWGERAFHGVQTLQAGLLPAQTGEPLTQSQVNR